MKVTVFFILANFIAIFCLNAQKRLDLKFEHLDGTDGLSHSSVNDMCQDREGYMWIGTLNGLNRYDGYKITSYKNVPNDTTSLTNSEILDLLVDSENNLWACTERGLCRYDRDKDQFERIKELGNVAVVYIYEDRNKDLWVIADRRLHKYNPQTKVFENEDIPQFEEDVLAVYEDSRGTFWISADGHIYTYDRQAGRLEKKLAIGLVHSFQEDDHDNFWFISYARGLYLYDRDNDTYELFSHDEDDPNSLLGNQVLSLEVDHLDRIWVGAENAGLSVFDYAENQFYNFANDPGDPESLGFNTVQTIFEDDSHHMWLGTFSAGVDQVLERKFAHFKNNALDKTSLSNNIILSFLEDSRGNIWIGTDGGGLNLFNKASGEFKQFRHDPDNPNSISTDVVTSIAEDKEGNLWLGCYNGGLNKFDVKKNKFTHYKHNESDPHSLLGNNVMYLYVDKKNNLWVGTTVGLNLLDRSTGNFISYWMDVSGLGNYPGCMLEDKDENLWYGSWNGLFLMDIATKEAVYYGYDEKDSTSISNNRIFTIHEDSKGKIWIGTASGLNLFNKEKGTFTAFYESDGLPSNAIYGILEDDHGNLWLSTGNGICRFNPSTKSTKNFNVHDGLQGNEFKIHAYLKLQSGEMLFGGGNGFNMFHPDRIKENPHIPPLVITDFKIFNSSVKPSGEKSPLKKHISQAKEINLSYKHSVFSFEYSALNYLAPEKNQYAYKMEGFDENWNYVGKTRSATYTNLDPGRYTFHVKGSNNDGLWNEAGTSIDVIITPPFWQTWWFRILALFASIGLALTWYSMRIRSIKKQNEELESQVKERTAEISQQKNELKEQGEVLEGLFMEMKDSIKAAKVIQQSIFPQEDSIKKYLPESFILNKPKDVVSGDFYWFEMIESKIVIAVVDCTGHGVSGAFMSIIGQNQLNQAIHKSKAHSAADILDSLNEGIIKELHQKDENSMSGDGMDMALCIIDKDKKQLHFAGANNPLYILRDKRIVKVPGSRYPIGMVLPGKVNKFKNNIVDLQAGDVYYIFSDGYADQIGGPDQKKFMYNRLRALLIEAGHEPMHKQREILESAFTAWRGDAEQLDDVMMIGFKV